jgi:putative flippase GtrA
MRSAGVGVAATLFDLIALHALVQGVGLSARAASLPALLLGIGTQFVGNKFFAFGDKRPAWLRQGAQFLGVEALGMLANLLLFDCLVAHAKVPYLAARMLATFCVYFAICLPLWSRIFIQLEEKAE